MVCEDWIPYFLDQGVDELIGLLVGLLRAGLDWIGTVPIFAAHLGAWEQFFDHPSWFWESWNRFSLATHCRSLFLFWSISSILFLIFEIWQKGFTASHDRNLYLTWLGARCKWLPDKIVLTRWRTTNDVWCIVLITFFRFFSGFHIVLRMLLVDTLYSVQYSVWMITAVYH